MLLADRNGRTPSADAAHLEWPLWVADSTGSLGQQMLADISRALLIGVAAP